MNNLTRLWLFLFVLASIVSAILLFMSSTSLPEDKKDLSIADMVIGGTILTLVGLAIAWLLLSMWWNKKGANRRPPRVLVQGL